MRSRETTALFSPGLYRAYGFSTEPTSLAWYLCSFGPLAIYYIVNNFKFFVTKYILILVILCAFTLSFSAAAFLYLSLGLFFICTYFRLWNLFLSRIFIAHLILLIFAILFVDQLNDLLLYYFEGIFDKLTLNEDYKSSRFRYQVFMLAIERFIENPFLGQGLGLTSSLGEMSPMCWYLILLTNGGFFAFFCFALFAISKLVSTLLISDNIGIYLTLSLATSFMFLATTSVFYNPFIWTLLSVISLYKFEYRTKYIYENN